MGAFFSSIGNTTRTCRSFVTLALFSQFFCIACVTSPPEANLARHCAHWVHESNADACWKRNQHTRCTVLRAISRNHHRLVLRGGWEEDEEDSEYSDWSDEEETEYSEEEGAASATQATDNPQQTWVTGNEDGRIEGLVRMNEELTTEEIISHPMLLPMPLDGGWDGGHNRDIERRAHRYFEEGRDRGPMPEDSVPPLRLADLYGLGNWTYMKGELPELDLTEENLEVSRNILKVPPEELPEVFHFEMGKDPLGRDSRPLTLAIRFANWTGPLPTVWQAAVYSPKGRIYVNSFSKDIEMEEPEAVEEFGGEECYAFFMDATERLLDEGARHFHLDGTFEPGPVHIGADVVCGAASGVDPLLWATDDARDRIVPDHHPYVFQAVRERQEGERVLCRAGRRCWAKASQQYPRWAIDVGLDEGGRQLHLKGEGSGLSRDFKTEDDRRGDGDGGAKVSELSGQWVLSNETFGSFSSCRLEYITSLHQILLQVHSGPWVVEDCDVTCAHGICVQASFGSLLCLARCRVGGSGPDHTVHIDEPGHALFGLDVEGDGNATVSDSLFRDIGLQGGAAVNAMAIAHLRMRDCEVRACRLALQMSQFPDVKLVRCGIEDAIDAAFMSECYRMVPPRLQDEFERLQDLEDWEWDERGCSRSTLRDDPRNAGALGSDEDRGVDGDCREGRLELEECRVEGKVWLTTNRPFSLHSDVPELM